LSLFIEEQPATFAESIEGWMTMDKVIPVPAHIDVIEAVFPLTASAKIYVDPGTDELMAIAQYLAECLSSATGYELQVYEKANPSTKGDIYLTIAETDPTLGGEGYELSITPDRLCLSAYQPAGLFWGVQTLRQLLPFSSGEVTVRSGVWEIGTGRISDYPRFGWRGVMLDVARHFFGVDDVKQFIDLLAYYKLNRLHLHLTDDQGWRLMIHSWPKLASYGGSSAVGGEAGGYYTQAEYGEIVSYAQSRYITVVPEIDLPGHTSAALASYAELNCNEKAPPLYTGTEVGFSSLCIDKEITYSFVEDVIREVAALTPGPYFHIGGDEAHATKTEDYVRFIQRVQSIVQSCGKQMVGWEEIAQADLLPTSIVQHWLSGMAFNAVKGGAKVIMSPASRIYLDIKYDESTPLGLNWAGTIEIDDAYIWDPAQQLQGISENDVLGVEAPLWSETLRTLEDVEYMAFPRLIGCAEIGWSQESNRRWEEYRKRLASHGSRLTAMGINYYRSPLIPWL
jgi:hexosaminidase